jgi:hypothetical protein
MQRVNGVHRCHTRRHAESALLSCKTRSPKDLSGPLPEHVALAIAACSDRQIHGRDGSCHLPVADDGA